MASLTFSQTRSSSLTLLVSGGFLFSGLMFGPDLDIYSRQFQRWGWLRYIWIPYQKSLHHRSFLSHGPVIGTALRVLYLGIWMAGVGGVVVTIAVWVGVLPWNWQMGRDILARSLHHYFPEAIALLLGCELGAMSHSLSDWGGSAYKRLQRQGFPRLLPQGKRRNGKKSSSAKSHSSSKRRPRSGSKSRSRKRR